MARNTFEAKGTPPRGIYFDSRETATILAALRLWQQTRPSNPELHAIATDEGEFLMLDQFEINDLCEKVNV